MKEKSLHRVFFYCHKRLLLVFFNQILIGVNQIWIENRTNIIDKFTGILYDF